MIGLTGQAEQVGQVALRNENISPRRVPGMKKAGTCKKHVTALYKL
jgi:hypothetical protein